MFKLNQIQTDIRREINEETKDDKIHGNRNIYIKNNKSKKPFVDEVNEEESNGNRKRNNDKRYLTISGIKIKKNNSIEVNAEKESILENKRGLFIDKTK
ncbi:MAG: hypothetical protein GX275_13525 [Clostridiales bacterium]|nr:hypothetical protein [Clostridiales bacterium]